MECNSKILIITYYWPPAGGIAVKRWLSLANELAKLNTEVHVLTLEAESAEYSSIDEDLLSTVDERIHIHRARAWNPFRLTKRLFQKHMPPQGFSSNNGGDESVNLLTRLRSHLFIPDPRKTWNARAIKKAVEIIDAHSIEAMITTSPPHSVQLIGRKVAKKRPIHWIADFRDPWTDIFYYDRLGHSALSNAIDESLERKVLSDADAITTVSWGFKDLFARKVPRRDPNGIFVIPNGIDRALSAWKREGAGEIFRMVYTGMLTDLYEIEPFLQAIKAYNSRMEMPQIEFDFYGSVSDAYRSILEEEFEFIQFHGNRPMQEIPQIQDAADGLFLVGPKDYNAGHIPGKLFEYLGAARPIFYLGDFASDVSRILNETQTGTLFDRNRTDDHLSVLQDQMNKAQQREEVPQREDLLTEYLRSNQAQAFLEIVRSAARK
ncbi:MAG: hypothetical protein CL834_00100 [Crocinitomicaceae bacterium]|nr:hypothetical protein [Crocinitomicaceae bacterium]